MSKFQKAALILKDHQEWRLGGDGEPTNPQALTSAVNHAIEALTQAAEIERGDKVVVPREPSDDYVEKVCLNAGVCGGIFESVHSAMITASEGE